ncbi:hypothetical protein LCGC14_1589460 [marine sediment metagenome]|uniref:Uncharacterized protein n=1 Tax=marine sediment metagenome TaxID=412755 RepID=A0A0F9J0P2_9ZZZZ
MGLIKSTYRLRGDQVINFDKEGKALQGFDGLFEFVKDKVLENLEEGAEFRIATWGHGNFEKVTKEQWTNYVRKDE